MSKLYLLQVNWFLYFALHKLLRKAYKIENEEEHLRFMSQYVSNLFEAYSLVDGFLKEYNGDLEIIDTDYSRPVYTQLSEKIFLHFPSYKKYIGEGDEVGRIRLSQNFQPISELHSILQRKRYSEKL